MLCRLLICLVSKTCFLSFSTQNHAELIGNYIKNSVLDPKRAILNQKSEICAHMGPARALEEREEFRKNALFCLRNTFLSKIILFGLQTTFL